MQSNKVKLRLSSLFSVIYIAVKQALTSETYSIELGLLVIVIIKCIRMAYLIIECFVNLFPCNY